MVEKLALKIAAWLKAADPSSDADVEVMAYDLGYRITNYSIVLFTSIIGLISGAFLDTLLGLIAFALLRYFTDGFHFKSLTTCVVVSTIILTVIPHIELNNISVILLNSLSAVILLVLLRNKYRLWYIPVLIITCNFFIQSEVIAIALTLQTFLVIPWQNGGVSNVES